MAASTAELVGGTYCELPLPPQPLLLPLPGRPLAGTDVWGEVEGHLVHASVQVQSGQQRGGSGREDGGRGEEGNSKRGEGEREKRGEGEEGRGGREGRGEGGRGREGRGKRGEGEGSEEKGNSYMYTCMYTCVNTLLALAVQSGNSGTMDGPYSHRLPSLPCHQIVHVLTYT